MSYSYSNPQNRIRARKLRDVLLERVDDAKAEIVSDRTLSKVGENAFRHYDLERLDGVHVYRNSRGWCADLVFVGLPTGIPTVVGTPAGMEASTTPEAIVNAVATMAFVARSSEEHDAALENVAVFSIDGVELSFPVHVLDATIARSAEEGQPTVEYTLQRLEQLCMTMTDGERPVTREDIAFLSSRKKMAFDAVCAQALILGIPRYLSPGMTKRPAPSLM